MEEDEENEGAVPGRMDSTARTGGSRFGSPRTSIAPVCVGGALAGHIVLTRALLRRR
mgnify:CR=1 FL=1